MLSSRNTAPSNLSRCCRAIRDGTATIRETLPGAFQRVGHPQMRAVSLPRWGPLPLPARAAVVFPCPLPPAPLPCPEGGSLLCLRVVAVGSLLCRGERGRFPLSPRRPARPCPSARVRLPGALPWGSARDRPCPSRRAVPPLPRARPGGPPLASPQGVRKRPRPVAGESGFFVAARYSAMAYS